MMLYDHLKFKNTETGEEQTYQLAVSQYGSAAPTSTTPGKPGVLYMDTSNGNLYKCTAADPSAGSYTWVAMVGAGGLFAAGTKGEGKAEISVTGLRISKPNAGYELSIGDKLITSDNYLYEITALPADVAGGYTAKLVCALGTLREAERTKGIILEANMDSAGAASVSVPVSSIVMPVSTYTPSGGDYLITTDNYLYRISGFSIWASTPRWRRCRPPSTV